MDSSAVPPFARSCSRCGTELGPGVLACPSCHALTHAEELADLSRRARDAEASGDVRAALEAWRHALTLLPAGTRQHQQVAQRVGELAERAPAFARKKHGSGKWWSLAGIGALVLTVASKGKLVVLGLTKLPTLLTMLAFFGLYIQAWGWKFAAGIVLSLYVHEMGHVWEMKRRGLPVSAPMFVPGLGAFVRMQQHPATKVEDARIGLAGPIWGLAAAVAALLLFFATREPLFAGVAKVGAWINLFNLLPVWQLDGSRGVASLTRAQRLAVAFAFGVAWALTRDGLLVILAIVAFVRALSPRCETKADHLGLVQFLGLIATLSALAAFPVPTIEE